MSSLVSATECNTPAPLHHSETEGKVPVDEFGMPYLIHPYDTPRNWETRWDDDHSFFFSDLPELDGVAGTALRVSRVQYVPRWLHDRKHNLFYREGVQYLPDNERDKFALSVLACAGYASKYALDLRGQMPKIVRMSRRTHEFVRGKNQLHFETKRDYRFGFRTEARSIEKIGTFFADYIRRHGFEDRVDDRTIDEFLNSVSSSKRRRLGNKIIGHAAEAVVEPIRPMYRDALRSGHVRPTFDHPLKVIMGVFPQEKWPDYHDSLSEVLVA